MSSLECCAFGSGGSAPRGQSLLRSFLATHSFPPRPPGYVLNRAQAAPWELTVVRNWPPITAVMRGLGATRSTLRTDTETGPGVRSFIHLPRKTYRAEPLPRSSRLRRDGQIV